MTPLPPLTGNQMVDLMNRWRAGEDWQRIANAMCLSLGETLEHAYRMGIRTTQVPAHERIEHKNAHKRLSDHERKQFIEAWNRGDSLAVMADRFWISEQAVSSRAKRAGLRKRYGGTLNSSRQNAKTSPPQKALGDLRGERWG